MDVILVCARVKNQSNPQYTTAQNNGKWFPKQKPF